MIETDDVQVGGMENWYFKLFLLRSQKGHVRQDDNLTNRDIEEHYAQCSVWKTQNNFVHEIFLSWVECSFLFCQFKEPNQIFYA